MKPFVSIILSTFNRVNFLKYISIPSVLRQTHKEWELIIVDDHSQDKTPLLIEGLSKKIKNLRYIRFEENKGYWATLNEGFKVAKGEYIALLDADDGWFSTKLEKQIKFLKKNELWASTCQVFQYNFLTKKIEGISSIGLPGFIGSKKFFNAILPLTSNSRGIEDIEFFLKTKLSEINKSIPPSAFKIQNEPLVFFIRHPQSTSFYGGKEKSAIIFNRYKIYLDYYSKLITPNSPVALKKHFAEILHKLAFHSLILNNKKEAKKNFFSSLKLHFSSVVLFLNFFSFLPPSFFLLVKKFYNDFYIALRYKVNLLRGKKFYHSYLEEINFFIKQTKNVQN